MAAAKMLKKDLELLVAQLQAELAEVKAQRDEALARIEVAKTEYRKLRVQFEEMREIVASCQTVFVRPQPRSQEPKVTRFYRGGQLWEKVRVGNQATERLVEPRTEFRVLAGRYAGNEENCKYANTFTTREEAEAALAEVSDYPWSRIEEKTV